MVICIVGGGASGVFAAIACREVSPDAEIILIEQSDQLQRKVRVSGGGRCNCSHAARDVHTLLEKYPRGRKFLRGPIGVFGPQNTADWFAHNGITLKTEPDGRIFPSTDRSSTITDCFMQKLSAAGVVLHYNTALTSLERSTENGRFICSLSTSHTLECDRLLMATGGLRDSDNSKLLRGLGHTIIEPVPSLFSLVIHDPRIATLPGVAAQDARVAIPGTRFAEQGPLLITHNGLSGPAMLALSSRAARYLHDCKYATPVTVAWCASLVKDRIPESLHTIRLKDPKGAIAARSPFPLPGRLWQSLVAAAAIPVQKRWGELSKQDARSLAEAISATTFNSSGMDTNKKEFVTCGGVSLDEVDGQTMESKKCKGLYFSGELLDIDGLTGGYNLQAAWATGYCAGRAMGKH